MLGDGIPGLVSLACRLYVERCILPKPQIGKDISFHQPTHSLSNLQSLHTSSPILKPPHRLAVHQPVDIALAGEQVMVSLGTEHVEHFPPEKYKYLVANRDILPDQPHISPPRRRKPPPERCAFERGAVQLLVFPAHLPAPSAVDVV